MGFVPGFKHDVFISYAHVDDVPPASVDTGWVTTLARELRRLLSEQLGRSDNHSVWMDYNLAGNDPITPVILDELTSSATLVIFLSEGYLSSPWCIREADAFLARLDALKATGASVFVVEKHKIERERWPEELADLRGYPFWTKDRDNGVVRTLAYPCPIPDEDRDYYRLVDDLSRNLVAALREKQAAAVSVPDQNETTSSLTTVFLAEVTDDLFDQRQRVKSYLEQQQIRVLPEGYYPNDPQQFREQQQAALADCRMFVQLLSDISGRKIPGADNGFPCLQHEVAAAADVPIMQWYDPELDLGEIDDPEHLALLNHQTVLAMPIEEFKARIIDELTAKTATESAVEVGDAFVFVNHAPQDQELATQVRGVVDELGLGYALPLSEGSPAEVRKDLEQNVLASDAVVFLYGSAPAAWVRSSMSSLRKILRGRRQCIALCEGPPPDKQDVGMSLPGMRFLNCRNGLQEGELRDFLQELGVAGAP